MDMSVVFIQLLDRQFYELAFAAFKCTPFFDFFLKNVSFSFKRTFFTSERSQNTVLLASTQAVYKAPHSTVREQQ